ncbi:hypothetical protein [Candidatus Enterococcus clewellii]|uniref:Uncharacterized protein n=1 Tax=Candidatus Enterococcus clewellii TaxID=1834193 RepID=A0AAQ3VWU9_9ENTE
MNKIFSKLIIQKIESYFKQELSKEELGVWAKKEYYKIIIGEYIFIEKLLVYSFLKKIATVHIEEDDVNDEYPASISEMKAISSILKGETDTVIFGEVRVDLKFSKKQMDKEKLHKIRELKSTIESSMTNEDELQLYLNQLETYFLVEQTALPVTVIDLLEIFMNNLLIKLGIQALASGADPYFSLYPKKEKRTKDSEIEKLLKVISCILGEESFEVCMIYKKGIGSISVLV